jgi:SAM-dependent methyltransferase
VLDPGCKLPDVDKVYVADSTFFVSSKAVNPTLTITEPALRVAEAIAQRLSHAPLGARPVAAGAAGLPAASERLRQVSCHPGPEPGGPMGYYAEHVLPRILNVACGVKAAQPLRRRVCEGLAGDVVEIGYGTGHNVAFYPATVTRVAAVEPSDLSWRLAAARTEAAPVPVERAALDGQDLPFADASFDAALSTWTLCTIPDPVAALRELRRVLKPGARLHFLEHGLAPDESVRRWQHRLEPINKRLVGGCHLTRPVVKTLTEAGFVIDEVDVFYEKGAPKPMGADSLGVAVSP